MNRLFYFICLSTVTIASATQLPEGEAGLAARYPGDRGIEKNEDVIFTENFDVDAIDKVFERWENAKNKPGMSLSPGSPVNDRQSKSLLITHVGGQGTGSHLYRRIRNENTVFARFYVKFDPDCAPIHHFGTHLGGFNPSTPWPQGGAGERPDGTKRFTTGVEPYGKSWNWDFYSYWQGMHRHGDGRFWGTPFMSGSEKQKVDKGRWICVEMMLKCNDPVEASNGEQAFWINGRLWRQDGQVISHAGPGFPKGRWAGGWWQPNAQAKSSFEGLKWRSTEDLAVNYVWTYLYITKAPKGHVSRVWFDNIVVARKYIGPMKR